MAGAAQKTNPPKPRKRVEADASSLKRARDGSAFTRCEACNKDVSVALIDMHSCSLDSKIRMNLEAQVVEKETQMKKPERKRASPTANKERKSKKEKKSNDPNKPKRPLSAYFIFLEEFRKTFKDAHPDSKGVTTVTKEGGEKWKSLSEEEKKVYTDKAAELKEEYLRAIEKYNAEAVDEEKEVGSEQEGEGEGEKKKKRLVKAADLEDDD